MKGVEFIADYRDDLYVSLYRRWLIVDQLGFNRARTKVLSVQKAAFFDFLLKNPKDMHNFLVSFTKLNGNSPYADILYSNDAEHGASLEVKDFLHSMLVLEAQGYVEVSSDGLEYLVSPGENRLVIDTELTARWMLDISLLKPLVSRSLSVLQKNSLR